MDGGQTASAPPSTFAAPANDDFPHCCHSASVWFRWKSEQHDPEAEPVWVHRMD